MELGLKSHTMRLKTVPRYPSPAHASLPTAVWARPLLLHAALLSLAHVPGQPHALNAIRPGDEHVVNRALAVAICPVMGTVDADGGGHIPRRDEGGRAWDGAWARTRVRPSLGLALSRIGSTRRQLSR